MALGDTRIVSNAALGTSFCPYQVVIWGGIQVGYMDQSGVIGNCTINAPTGRVRVGGVASTTVVVTNSYCFATSVVLCQIEDNPVGGTYSVICVPSNGSFAISTVPAGGGNGMIVRFAIINTVVGGP